MCNDISRRELLDDCDEAYEFSNRGLSTKVSSKSKMYNVFSLKEYFS